MPVIQITISEGRSIEQKRELVKPLTRETARIMNTQVEGVRILIYEVSKEIWGNAGILGFDINKDGKWLSSMIYNSIPCTLRCLYSMPRSVRMQTNCE